MDLLTPTEGVGWVACDHLNEAGELAGMPGQEFIEALLEAGRGSVGVDTDGPEPGLLRDRLPELLRNREDSILGEGTVRESVGQDAQTLFGEGAEGVAIESVTGCDEEIGLESMSVEDCESGTNPLPLERWVDACEFRLVVQAEKGLAAIGAQMTVAMHADCGARSLQRSHSNPEFRIGILSNQIAILIVWNDREKGSDAMARKDREESLAPILEHGGTKIVESNEILRRPLFH